MGPIDLLRAMLEVGTPRIILSSAAAVCGEPKSTPITEDHSAQPIHPYGWTRLACERLLGDYSAAYDIRAVIFRHCNAAGALPDLRPVEAHKPETRLIPLAIRAALEASEPPRVSGDDYPTPDGTCVRDDVHVKDLADAHRRALDHLLNGGASDTFNPGTESGASIKHVIARPQALTGLDVPHAMALRRPGDPATLVASHVKAHAALRWLPEHDLDSIALAGGRGLQLPVRTRDFHLCCHAQTIGLSSRLGQGPTYTVRPSQYPRRTRGAHDDCEHTQPLVDQASPGALGTPHDPSPSIRSHTGELVD